MEKRYNLISGKNIKSITYQDNGKIIIEVTGKGFREFAEQFFDFPLPLKSEKNQHLG